MADRSQDARQDRRRLDTTAFVLGTTALTLVLLSAVALLTIVRTPPALRFFDPRRSPSFDEGWLVSTMDYALSSSERNDVIFVGDSECRTAIDPIRFESLTRLRGFNLGLVGDLGPEVRLDLASAYLSKHPAPRLMVLCVSPIGMERDVPAQWQMLRDRCIECFGFEQRSVHAFEERVGYFLRQGTLLAWDRAVSRLFGNQRDLRDSPFLGTEKETYRGFDSSTRSARGFMPLWGNKYDARLHHADDLVLIDSVWDAGVRRLAEKCNRVGLPLMIRLAPIPAEGSETLNFDKLERWLQEMRRSYRNVIIGTDHEILRYPPELFWDGTHPNAAGAEKFTETLAAEVRGAIDPPGKTKAK